MDTTPAAISSHHPGAASALCGRFRMRIATDGSARRLQDGTWLAAWAWVPVDSGGRPLGQVRSGMTAETSPVRAELSAICEALQAAPVGAMLEVQTDCQSLVWALNHLEELAGEGFVTSRAGPSRPRARRRANSDQFAAIHEVVRSRRGRTRFRWVRGHAGHLGNRACDLAARSLVRSQAAELAAELVA
jgi:ribonuclease HI